MVKGRNYTFKIYDNLDTDVPIATLDVRLPYWAEPDDIYEYTDCVALWAHRHGYSIDDLYFDIYDEQGNLVA